LEDHILSDVKLKVTGVESGYNLQLAKIINLEPSEKIKVNEKRFVYAVLTKESCEHPFPQAKVSQKLQLKITEIEVDSQDELGSYEEDYALEPMNIAVRDYLTGQALLSGQFKTLWEQLGADPKLSEAVQSF